MNHKMLGLLLLLHTRLIAQSTSADVELQSVNHYFPKAYNQVGTSQSTSIENFKGVPIFLVEKVVRSSNTVRGQAQFEAFQRGELSETEWRKIKQSYGRDTTALSNRPLRQKINALVGTDKQGRRIVIVDANNNQDFSDDQVLYYPMTLPTIERNKDGLYSSAIHAIYDTLPAIRVETEAFDGSKIITRTAWVKPNPYNDGWTYKNPTENQFHLTLLANEYREGNTTLLGRPLTFVITSGVAGLPYNTQTTTIQISQETAGTTLAGTKTTYRIGQSFILDNHRIEIANLSIKGDKLYLADRGLADGIISKPEEK